MDRVFIEYPEWALDPANYHKAGDVEPFSQLFDTFHITASDPTPSLADALYPSSYEILIESLNPPIERMAMPTYGTDCHTVKIFDFFSGPTVTKWAHDHWEVPIIACTAYVIMIFVLSRFMRNREPMKLKVIKTMWNFGLSAFSWSGFFVLANHLLFSKYAGIFTAGFQASLCTHPTHFGCSYEGIAIAAFCYSKCFELIDTVFIILAKRPLIFLHWYHHITVLLFCWLSYGSRNSNGIYFAVVNYCIHGIMYGYYGMTQLSPYTRSLVKPYAMQVTFLQLSQMAFGVMIIGATVYYKYYRIPCYTTSTVNFLGLIMYISYFILFLQIFLDRYFGQKAKQAAKKKKA